MLNEEREQFQKEQDQLLKTILDLRFFLPWHDTKIDEGALQSDTKLEIYITNECDKRCKYCYLWKNKGLYPQDKLDHQLILNNLKILYEWMLKKEFYIPEVSFFTGEIWYTQFGLDILDLTLQYIKKGLRVNSWMIPANCSFIEDDIQTAKIQSYINAFSECGQPLLFSISVDGKLIEEEMRPSKETNINYDEYWDKLFTFAKHNNYYFHPMVSAKSIHKWIENYKWWESQLKKYNYYTVTHLMLLEVRNDDWTEENINDYCKFLDFLVDKYLQDACQGDIKKLANHVFNIRNTEGNQLDGYIPYCFPHTDTFIGCTQATDLTVRLGDLAICPCHRLAYDKYIYGHFKVENNEIVDIIANNPQVAIKILMANFNLCSFGCDTCTFNNYCLKGCHGMQYESMGDPFIPNPNICYFFKRKYSFLIEKYKELGVIDYLKTVSDYEQFYDIVQDFLTLVKKYEKSKQCGEQYGMGKS